MPVLEYLASLPRTDDDQRGVDPDIVQQVLHSVRQHLDMEIAYVSEFVGGESVFRFVDAPGLEALIKPGDSRSLDDVYCRHILAGRLPELMPDTAQFALAAAMPVTQAVPIGAHVSVPLRMSNGEVFGMFCCLSPRTNASLNDRDLQIMRAFAEIAARQIDKDRGARIEFAERRERITSIIANTEFSTCFQPIWNIGDDRLIGFECLSRFHATPQMSPDKWFAEAAGVGLGVELEHAALAVALEASRRLPDQVYVAVNASAEAVTHAGFEQAVGDFPLDRLVLELTEHTTVASYLPLTEKLDGLRKRGLRLAIDDAGAGYSGLQLIVSLRPDIIKLDMSLTRDVDSDPARRALASALIYYARETGCELLAEGIETVAEQTTLKLLGVRNGQGYLFGKPASLLEAIEFAGRKAA